MNMFLKIRRKIILKLIPITLEFSSRECNNLEHLRCVQLWEGLGFQARCNCLCHNKKELEVPFQGDSNSSHRSTQQDEIVSDDR
jgi:hypothetical protein